jgi:amino acid permease
MAHHDEKHEVDVMTDVHQPALAAEQQGLKRDLRLRHMIMIAVSGTIGTGLFLTSGKTIATAGPGGACKQTISSRRCQGPPRKQITDL